MLQSFEREIGVDLDEACANRILDAYSEDELDSMDEAELAVVGFTLGACRKLDREGTRDNIIESFESEIGLELDEACVDGVLDGYSDDELESIDDAMNANEMTEQAQEFALEIFDCVPGS